MLYCRQRQLKQHQSRKKSCSLCRRAKTRCSETLPQCNRCKAKGLECKYDRDRRLDFDLQLLGLDEPESGTGVEVDISELGEVPPTQVAQVWQLSSVDPSHGENSQVGLQPNTYTLSHESVLDSLLDDTTNLNWDFSVPQDEILGDGIGGYAMDQITQDVCSSARQPAMSLSTGLGHADQRPLELRYLSSATGANLHLMLNQSSSLHPTTQALLEDFSDPNFLASDMSLLSARAARIEPISSTARKIGLFRRRERSFGSQLSAYFLLQTLRSYPKMMLAGTLPPFIHDYGVSVNDSTQAPDAFFLEPLAICKSIMCMYFSKSSSSTSFVWRTIDLELSRLETEVKFPLQVPQTT